MFGILPTRVHGFLDYVIGLSLVLMSFIFARGAGPQTWLPVVLGGGMIVYSLLTEYEMGIVPLIRMPYHLILDVLGGSLLAGSPFLFGFAYIIWVPHVVLGLAAMTLGLVTQTQATRRTFAADFGASP